ncbi:MAG: glycosyltransferase family 1 protein [Bacteroidetes bacterium]|nr:MAG: glycosyltransferase family 1 protein [Bacteroidota bacterium]
MKIAVNTRLLIKNKLDGIGWFTYENLKRITQSHQEHQFYFLFDRPFSDEFIFSKNIEPIIVSPSTRHPVLWYYWFEKRIPCVLNKIKPDIFLSPDGYLSLTTNVKSIPVIHDINFAHFPEDLPYSTRLYYNYFFPKYAKKAERIVTVSEYSKQDISSTYNIDKQNIDVVYNGSNPIYKPISDLEKINIKKEYTDGSEYFIFIGSIHPRKNVSRMLLAFDKFRKLGQKPYKIIIIGSLFFKNREMRNTLNSLEYKKDILFFGHQSPENIKDLLGAARALILASKFEGFGIPVLEAMNCDVPSIISESTSLPEVGGNAALYIDPFSIDSISNAMLKVADDTKWRNQLIENGKIQRKNFSWDKTANKLWESILKATKLQNQTSL